jgi:hypothetical protein
MMEVAVNIVAIDGLEAAAAEAPADVDVGTGPS